MSRPTQLAHGARLTGTDGATARASRSFGSIPAAITVGTSASALLAALVFLVSSAPAEAADRSLPATASGAAAAPSSSTPMSASTAASMSATTSASSARPAEVASEVYALAASQIASKTADLPTVLNNATAWVVGILATVATLFLTIGGARYLMAGGDPGEVERAKGALKSAGIGYALALLAPVFLQILRGILGVGQ